MNLGFSFYTGSLSQERERGQLGLSQTLTVMQHSKQIPTYVLSKRMRLVLHFLSIILWTF